MISHLAHIRICQKSWYVTYQVAKLARVGMGFDIPLRILKIWVIIWGTSTTHWCRLKIGWEFWINGKRNIIKVHLPLLQLEVYMLLLQVHFPWRKWRRWILQGIWFDDIDRQVIWLSADLKMLWTHRVRSMSVSTHWQAKTRRTLKGFWFDDTDCKVIWLHFDSYRNSHAGPSGSKGKKKWCLGIV